MLNIVLVVGIVLVFFSLYTHDVELRMCDFNNAEAYSCSVWGEGGLDVPRVEQCTFLFQPLPPSCPGRCVSVCVCELRSTRCSELRLVSCRQIKPCDFQLVASGSSFLIGGVEGGGARGTSDSSIKTAGGRVVTRDIFFFLLLRWRKRVNAHDRWK